MVRRNRGRRRPSRRPRRLSGDAAIAALVQQITIAMRGQIDPAELRYGRAADELRFHPSRGWRFDLAAPSRKVAVELEGGIFRGHQSANKAAWLAQTGDRLQAADVAMLQQMGGRHNRGAGMREDFIKYNEAATLGWVVLHVMPEMIEDGRALTWFEKVWRLRGETR